MRLEYRLFALCDNLTQCINISLGHSQDSWLERESFLDFVRAYVAFEACQWTREGCLLNGTQVLLGRQQDEVGCGRASRRNM